MNVRPMTIAIIPARGGSRRIPGKNKRIFHGKPIIQYSIETALAARVFDDVVVSSDDEEILRIARLNSATVHVRREHYAQDHVGTQDVAAHVLADYDTEMRKDGRRVDWACVIYPTAPLLTVEELLRGYTLMMSYDPDFVMSVGAHPLRDAAQFYWGRSTAFLTSVPLISEHTVMCPVPEATICDINDEMDWVTAETAYALRYPYHSLGGPL